jgi:glycosidase
MAFCFPLMRAWSRPCLALSLLLLAYGGGAVGGAPAATAWPGVDVSPVAQADAVSLLPNGWQSGAFMEIFVRAYQDSDGDGVGDLGGLTQRLDYLQELGVKGLWLMPVTRSEDHDHGYAVTDFRQIESAYGSLADFDELLAQAHARGMGVIVDYVVNHSAAQNPLFLNSAASKDNPWGSWFVWQDSAPTGWSIFGKNPWNSTPHGAYFSQFSPNMPDFNWLNPAVMAYHQDSMRFWLNRGVDGFRFDAVRHLVENGPDAWADQPGSFAVMAQLRGTIQRYPNRHMVCEATAHEEDWATDATCGSAFAFEHAQDIVNAARGQPAAIAALASYFRTAPASMATMVSNHDLFAGERLWDQVAGDQAQYRLAAATYLLQPGTPFIYYGEEIGMSAGAGLRGDAKLRTPMSWSSDSPNAGFSTGQPFRALSGNAAQQNVASQRADPNSLFAFYKAMLGLRNSLPSIARGSYTGPFVEGRVMGFQRVLGGETSLVLINYGTSPVAGLVVPGLAPMSGWRSAYPGAGSARRADAQGVLTISLQAQSVQVYVLGS